MASDLYVFPAWLEQVIEGNVNVLTDTLELVLFRLALVEGFDPDTPYTTMSDVDPTHVLSDPVELTNKSVANGHLYADDVFWASVDASSHQVRGGLVYWNTGPNPGDKMLVSMHTRRSDTTPVRFTVDGGPKLWRWSLDGVLSI